MANFKAYVKDKNGNVFELGDGSYVGAAAPADANKNIWFDTSTNCIKVNINGYWQVMGGGGQFGATTLTSCSGMPIGYKTIIVNVADDEQLSFVETLPAGYSVDIILKGNVASPESATVTIPNTGSYRSLIYTDPFSGQGGVVASSISLEYGKVASVRVFSDGTTMYITYNGCDHYWMFT